LRSVNKISELIIYNFSGEKILSDKIGDDSTGETGISLQSLKAGIYFYEVITIYGKIDNGKVVVQ
jgi:hypothetical protein